MTAGTQRVRVSLSATGFERMRQLTIRPNQVHEVEIQARQGRLRIAVAPWAKVKIDGTEVGVTPLQEQVLVEGTHHIELENPDIARRHDQLVRIQPGKVVAIRIDLKTAGEDL